MTYKLGKKRESCFTLYKFLWIVQFISHDIPHLSGVDAGYLGQANICCQMGHSGILHS
jgi:hypothetical protein